jgi:hypothetical protein
MIRTVRRGFWLTVGAAVGVGGYRKVTRLARAVSPVRAPADSGPAAARPAGMAGPAAALLVRGVRASALFARDVREGMRIYRLAGPRAAPGPPRHAAARNGAARNGAARNGATRNRAARNGAASNGAARHRHAKDWAFAEGECPDEVKDGR